MIISELMYFVMITHSMNANVNTGPKGNPIRQSERRLNDPSLRNSYKYKKKSAKLR